MVPEEKIVPFLNNEKVDVIVAANKQNVFYTSGLKILAQWVIGWDTFSVWSAEHGGPYLVYPPVDSNQVSDSNIDFTGLRTYGEFFYSEGPSLSPEDERVLEANDGVENHDSSIDALLSVLDEVVDEGSTVAIERDEFTSDGIAAIEETFSQAKFIEATGLFQQLRATKTNEEIERLGASVQITDEAIMETFQEATVGMTEAEFDRILRTKMVKKGASSPHHTVVGFAENSAHCHVVPHIEFGMTGDRELEFGDIIRVDAGCVFEGYPSDIARTAVVGESTNDYDLKYRIIHDTNEAVIDSLRDGADAGEAFNTGLEYIRQQGNEHDIPQFTTFSRHHFGHAIGVNIYDRPWIAPGEGSIAESMVMNVETPYYELGNAGIQVEDTILVTDGAPERLSQYPSELPILDA